MTTTLDDRTAATTGVAGALRRALRDVNAAFDQLPPAAQARVAIESDGLDQELDAALTGCDRERALAAIRAWRGHFLAEFQRASA